jgi:hypothetical protein
MPPGVGGMNRMASRQPAMMAPAASTPLSTQAAVPASAPAAAAVTGPPADSLLQHSPKPAVVSMASHSLSIQADNSTLSQILHEVSTQSGMKVEGLSKDDRIFGSYGPGDPHEVLLSLLEGCGYNVLMVGDTGGGAPRELTLSPRTAAGGITQNSAQASRNTAEEDNDDDGDVQQAPPPEPVQTPPPAQPNENGQPQQRSPQEILQELRARQQNQNGAQPNPTPPQPPQ